MVEGSISRSLGGRLLEVGAGCAALVLVDRSLPRGRGQGQPHGNGRQPRLQGRLAAQKLAVELVEISDAEEGPGIGGSYPVEQQVAVAVGRVESGPVQRTYVVERHAARAPGYRHRVRDLGSDLGGIDQTAEA